MHYTTNQQLFYDEALQGKNIYLSGKAGTGKSTIVKELIAKIKASGKKVAAVAPTGIAANNIDGSTIHSLFGIPPYGIMNYDECNLLRSEKRRLLQKIDTLIVDEISMLRPDILDAMHWTLKKNGCGGLTDKQVIFVGDLKQLPVVLNDNSRSVLYEKYQGEEFMHAAIYKKLIPIEIELDEIVRQTDTEFIQALNIIREGGKSEYFRQFVATSAAGIILAPHNATVQAYNAKGLAMQAGEEFIFDALVEGNAKADEFNVESQLKVKDGCKVMYLANSQNNPLRNGTLGIFVHKDGKHFIKVAGVEYALDKMKFVKKEYVYSDKLDALELKEIGGITQYPFKLAYALSIHKSQGLTFDEVTLDLTRPCFAKGQMYVALSRVRTPAGLKILV